jgi:hypothetical protein
MVASSQLLQDSYSTKIVGMVRGTNKFTEREVLVEAAVAELLWCHCPVARLPNQSGILPSMVSRSICQKQHLASSADLRIYLLRDIISHQF